MTDLESRRRAGSRLRHRGLAGSATSESSELCAETTQRTTWGLFGRRPKLANSRGWRNEPPAEFEMGRLLTQLGSEWTVLHTFDVFGELDADFLVVGPPGIFMVTSRVRAGGKIWVDENVLWVNGRPSDHIRDTRIAAERASTRLSSAVGETVRVTPVIALMDPASLSFGGDPTQRVVTLPAELLTQWLSECSRAYSDDAVAYFSMIAEERATWGSHPSGQGSVARLR